MGEEDINQIEARVEALRLRYARDPQPEETAERVESDFVDDSWSR